MVALAMEDQLKKKESKYKSKKTIVDGIKFDSKAESLYYLDLKTLKACGEISGFDLQPVYELQPRFKEKGKTVRAITYVADFAVCYPNGSVVVVDIKGMATETANIKRKMFMYKNPGIPLVWLCYVKKHGGFIDYFKLKKLRKANKEKNGANSKNKKS